MSLLRKTLAVTALALTGPGASAGGWAVSTLDPLSPPVAGRPTPIGFTVRQHGVTPVRLDDVGIVVRTANGAEQLYAARPSGPVGHYVATVRFPAAGTYSWQLRPGWFQPQDLGSVTVLPAGAAAGARRSRDPAVARYGLVGAGTALAVAALVPGRRGARRRRAAVPA